jgi:magnesium chelatase subunit I
LTVFKDRVDPSHTTPVVDAFEGGLIVQTGEEMTSDDLAALVEQIPALRAPVSSLTPNDPSAPALAAAVEFLLEGLHLSKRLNKDDSGTSATYRGRL